MTGRPKTPKFNRNRLGIAPANSITNWVVDDEIWIEEQIERMNSLPGYKVKATQHLRLERVWGIEKI